jgi:16S rRNA (cytidine1402-2'-O)-methyltransferase
MPGTLFVVATPIGNLEDITFRAVRTLREVGLVAAEDTRRTSCLLAHYDIRKPMVSLREHNEARETPRILARLKEGLDVALVSDAGTPGIADPGARLIRAAHEHGLRVVPIPGPSAVSAALSVSGFSGDQFVFMGFPPASGAARVSWLDDLVREARTMVFFEAPHRIHRTLTEVAEKLAERQIIVLRELTKSHEQLVIWDKLSPVKIKELGEFVVVVREYVGKTPQTSVNEQDVVSMFCQLTNKMPLERESAAQIVSSVFGLTSRQVLKLAKRARILADRQKLAAP